MLPKIYPKPKHVVLTLRRTVYNIANMCLYFYFLISRKKKVELVLKTDNRFRAGGLKTYGVHYCHS